MALMVGPVGQVARPYVARENLAASDFCNAIDPELRQAGGGIPAHGGQQLLLEERRVSGGSKRCNIRGNAREGCDFQELTSRQHATGHSGRLLGNRFSMPARSEERRVGKE